MSTRRCARALPLQGLSLMPRLESVSYRLPPRCIPPRLPLRCRTGALLYERFVAAWERVPDKTIKLVFHGTPSENIPSICKTGLDPKRRTGQAHGKGEYFGQSMDVSKGYCRNGRHMLVFAVLLDKSGLTQVRDTSAKQHMIVVHRSEHQLPLAVVTMSGKAFTPPPGLMESAAAPSASGSMVATALQAGLSAAQGLYNALAAAPAAALAPAPAAASASAATSAGRGRGASRKRPRR